MSGQVPAGSGSDPDPDPRVPSTKTLRCGGDTAVKSEYQSPRSGFSPGFPLSSPEYVPAATPAAASARLTTPVSGPQTPWSASASATSRASDKSFTLPSVHDSGGAPAVLPKREKGKSPADSHPSSSAKYVSSTVRQSVESPDDGGVEAGPGVGPVREGKTSRNATRHHHHPDVWEAHKAEIQEVYLVQNRPLKDVMALMRDKGFKATTRMYKSKFEQWGFAKNNRKKDVAMMLRLQQQRDASGKNTTFSRHGRAVDIANYMRRKRITKAELVALAEAAAADDPEGAESADRDRIMNEDLPEYLRALTPPPTENVVLGASTLHTQDVLLTCFRDLTRSWLDSATGSPAGRAFFMLDFSNYMDGDMCESTRDFQRACWFFSRGHTTHGALLSQRAFSKIHLIISRPSAMGLFDLLIASVLVPDTGLAYELWKYLAAYAEAVLGPNSSLTRLFQALDVEFRSRPMEDCADFIFNCLDAIVDMLLSTSGLADTVAPTISLFLIADFVLLNSNRRNLPSLQRASAAAANRSEKGGGDAIMVQTPPMLGLLGPATQLWLRGPEDEFSFQFAFGSLQHPGMLPEAFSWISWLLWQVVAGFHRSRYLADETTNRTRGSSGATPPSPDDHHATAPAHPRHALARYSLERCVDGAEGCRGFGEYQVFENLQMLEDWHAEAGDRAQQLAVRQRKEKALQAYLEDVQNSPAGTGMATGTGAVIKRSTSPVTESGNLPRTPASQ